MGVAVTRSISHGKAYSEYSQKKDENGVITATFIGAKNMVGNTDLIFDNTQLDDMWLELKEAGRDYVRKGKDVTRDIIAIEWSPTCNESEGWTNNDWFKHAEELISEIDKVQLKKGKRDPKTKEWITDKDGKKKMFSVPKTDLTNSKWLAYMHTDAKSGIPHLHIMISRYCADGKTLNCDTDIAKKGAQASEALNEKYGWTKAMDIRQQHIEEINGVINAIMDDMNGDRIDFAEFEKRVKAATFIDYKGREQYYDFQYHKDDEGSIDGYSIKRGNSKFTADQLGQKIVNIAEDRRAEIKDAVYGVLRDMNTQRFDWNKFVEMMQESGRYQIDLKRDSKGSVVRYNVMSGGRTYNASQIGPKLTAKKIVGEWERIHQELERKSKLQQQAEEKARTAKVIPFVKVDIWGGRRHDGSLDIGIIINEKKYPAKPLLPEHQRWFQQQVNQKQAMQDLLIHYFGEEIQQAQVESWKQQHFDAGKMPFGIVIGATYGTIGRMGDHFWLRGEFTQNGETKLKSMEVSREDYIKWKNAGGDDARAVVCNTVGRNLVKDWGFNPLSDIKRMIFESPADFSTTEGIEQSVRTFEAFTEQLCNDFMESCGEAAIAYFNAMLPSGISTGGGGGGHDTGGWRGKKDDDDWWKRGGTGIMGFHPPKKGTTGGRKV